MTSITYQNQQHDVNPQETVLDCLLRHDVDIPYACKAGVCHVCVMACEEGDVPSEAINGLRDIQIDNGYFLACQCVPAQSLKIDIADESRLFSIAWLESKTSLSDTISKLILKPKIKLDYLAGQFINIRMNKSHIRSYSLANMPNQDGTIELHIKKMHNGKLSHWLVDDSNVTDEIEIQGPFGFCTYQLAITDKDIIMIATGTGLAPVLGVLMDAFAHSHTGHISLYHGGRQLSDLYQHQRLVELAESHENFDYYPCITKSDNASNEAVNITTGRASEKAFSSYTEQQLANTHVYLCGSPEMVDNSKQQALILGAQETQIHCDPFVTKDLRLGKVR